MARKRNSSKLDKFAAARTLRKQDFKCFFCRKNIIKDCIAKGRTDIKTWSQYALEYPDDWEYEEKNDLCYHTLVPRNNKERYQEAKKEGKHLSIVCPECKEDFEECEELTIRIPRIWLKNLVDDTEMINELYSHTSFSDDEKKSSFNKKDRKYIITALINWRYKKSIEYKNKNH